jgi:hypothetical protein
MRGCLVVALAKPPSAERMYTRLTADTTLVVRHTLLLKNGEFNSIIDTKMKGNLKLEHFYPHLARLSTRF